MKAYPVILAIFSTVPLFSQSEEARKDTVYHLSPVIVYPTEARERISPVTFSDLTRLDLQERYSTQDVPVLLSDLPSVTYYSENGNGMGYNYINMRGFDQRRLSVMVNGIPQNDPEDHDVYWIDMPDLLASTESIQVQRGAGSAFYGPPAIGGSINLIANPFRQEPSITLETELGFQQYGDTHTTALGTRRYSASVNSGLIDQTYMIYGHLAQLESDGYRERGWINLNSYFLGAVRFDETMTTRFHFYGGPFTDGLVYTGLPKFVNSNPALRRQNLSDWGVDSTGNAYSYADPRRPQEAESFSQPHFEVLHEWRLSPGVTLNNTVFLIIGEGYYDYDASWADTSMLRIGYNYGIPTNQNPANTLVRAYVGNQQWGWLPRVDIDHGTGTLTLGGEFRFHRSVHWGKIEYAEGLPSNFNPDYHFYEYDGQKDMVSLYGHELYNLRDDVTLMLDLQFAYDRYGIANEKYLGYDFSYPYYFWNPRVGVNYNLDAYWNAYVSLASTSREPRLRNLYAAEDSYFGATPKFKADTIGGVIHYDFSQPLARPERLLDFELGAAFHASSARLNANLYWMEFTDELVENGQVDIFGEPILTNAQRTRHAGVEVDGKVMIGDEWTLSGNGTVSINRIIHDSEVDSSTTLVLDGNPIAGFPDVLGNLRLTYAHGSISVSLDAKSVGAFYTDNYKNPENRNDAYTVYNAEGTYHCSVGKSVGLTFRAEVRNLLNTLYLMNGDGSEFFPAAERNFLVGLSVHL